MYDPALTTADLLDRIGAGQQALREKGLVEPTKLIFALVDGRPTRWQWCCYIGLPEHPHGENAPKGFTHPATPYTFAWTAGDASCDMTDRQEIIDRFFDGAADIEELCNAHTGELRQVIFIKRHVEALKVIYGAANHRRTT